MNRCAALVAAFLAVASARAGVIEILDPGDIRVDGTVELPGTSPFFIANPFFAPVSGLSPLTMLYNAPGAVTLRRQVGTSWNSSFLPDGLELVWNDDGTGPIQLAFGSAIQGVGLYLESELTADTTFAITAIGEGLSILGSFTEFRTQGNGFFWGVVSDQQDIRTIQISSSFDRDMVLGGIVVQVPEPGTLALAGAGLAILAWARRKAGAAALPRA